MDYINRIENRLNGIFSWCDRNMLLVLIFFFALTFAVRYGIAFSAWHFLSFPHQRYDAFMYTIKGLEIADGDWLPIRTHGIGWPAVLGVVFRVWRGSSIFENLAIASAVAALFSALAIFPLFYLMRRIDRSPRTAVLLLVLFSSSFFLTLPEYDLLAMADPLFIFLFLLSLCFLYAGRRQPLLLAASGAAAALAYTVKPVGPFIIPVVIFSWILWERRLTQALLGALLFIVAFVAVSTPFLLTRDAAFGSPFDYGGNSRYFSDTYTDAWGEAVPDVTFASYVATHAMPDFFNKFFVGGFLFVFAMFFVIVLVPQFFAWLCMAVGGEEGGGAALYPIWIASTVWIAGLTPVFHIYGNQRHILPIVPLCLIIGAIGFRRLAEGARLKNAAQAGIMLFLFLFFAMSFAAFVFFSKNGKLLVRDASVWARHLAPRLHGNVAIGNGSDILMMQYPDSRIGGKGLLSMYAPRSGVAVHYPGKFASVEDFRPWLKSADIDYVVFDGIVRESFPFLPDKYLSIYTGVDFPPYLVPFYSNYESNSQWRIRVFRVDKKLL